jgi:transposase InsO family protein
MRRSASEKMEIIRIVEGSELGVKRTLEELGISRSTFYEWYKRYLQDGYEGLLPKNVKRRSFWNRIPQKERSRVIETALERPELSPREIAHHITDTQKWFVSESSVYRILKAQGLVTSPAWIVMAAADEFKDKTTRVHQQWQTDFTHFKIIGWGWYYLATVMDDYSRYIITWELCKSMESTDASRVVGKALQVSGLPKDRRPRLLSDNGPCYVSHEFTKFIGDSQMGHVRGAPYHPQTQGKIERYHRTMKNIVKLENYYYPDELRAKLEEFVDYYNHERYHESLNNLTPADVYYGRDWVRLQQRSIIKNETMKKRRRMNRKAAS